MKYLPDEYWNLAEAESRDASLYAPKGTVLALPLAEAMKPAIAEELNHLADWEKEAEPEDQLLEMLKLIKERDQDGCQYPE